MGRVGHTRGVSCDVRFLESSVGGRIAYTREGSGPPLVVVPPWTTHLEVQAGLSGHRSFHAGLSKHHRVVLYDRWGTGLSERHRADFSLQADLQVLRDVVDHLRLRRFSLVGPSHGGLPAVSFASEEPRRVSHLVLYGSRASALTSGATWQALRALIIANWPVAARSIASVATRGGAPPDVEAFAELLVASASPETTIALQDAAISADITHLLSRVQVPTLVLHRRDDPLVSCDEAVRLAARIPGARLELVPGEAHVHCVGDAALLAERIVRFTAGAHGSRSAQLSPREAEVLDLVAAGCTNAEVAAALVLSVRTVERHLLNAYTKLGVRGRTEAAARWRNHPKTSPSLPA